MTSGQSTWHLILSSQRNLSGRFVRFNPTLGPSYRIINRRLLLLGGKCRRNRPKTPPPRRKKRGAVVHDWTTSGNGKRKEKKSGTVTPVSKWVQAGIEIRQDKRSTSLDDTVIVPPYLSRRYFIVKQKQKNWIETSQQQCCCPIGFKETPPTSIYVFYYTLANQ